MESIIDEVHKGTFKSDTVQNWHKKHKQQHHIINNNNSDDPSISKEPFSWRKNLFDQIHEHKDTIYLKNKNSNSNISIPSSFNTHRKNKIRVDESGIEISSAVNIDGVDGTNKTISNNSTLGYFFNNDSNTTTTTTSTSMKPKIKRMKNANHVMDHCTQEYWSENLLLNNNGTMLQFQRKWSYNLTELKDKTVSFRLVYSPSQFSQLILIEHQYFFPFFSCIILSFL